MSYTSSPNLVAGFVIDVLITVNDLSALGMPGVKTRGGTRTGALVAHTYLRNIGGRSPIQDNLAHVPIFIMTVVPNLENHFPWVTDADRLEVVRKRSGDTRERVAAWLDSLSRNGINRETS